MQDKHGLLSAPITSVLRNMTIPMIFGMVSILMFNLVDTFFISLLGTQALAAISYTFPITFAVNCITMGIGVGLSSCIGRLIGQGQTNSAARLATHGLLLAIALIVLASFVGLISLKPLFGALGANSTVLVLIQQYMTVWYLTIPLLVIPMAGNSAIRATGDTKTPAYIMILAGVINGGLDPMLIFGFGPLPALGIQGAAIASAISWLCALGLSLYILATQKKLLTWPRWQVLLPDWQQILRIGTPAAFSNAMTPLSGAIIMSILSSYGTAAVAGYGAAQRIESVLIIVLMSLTSALTPFIAQNIGARQPERSFAGMLLSMRFSILFQLMIFVMLVPLVSSLASIFSHDPAVQRIIWLYLISVPISYGFQGVVMMLVSSLNALHQPLSALLWSCKRLFLFVLPCVLVGGYVGGIEGLYIGIALGNTTAGVSAYLHGLRLRRRYCINVSD